MKTKRFNAEHVRPETRFSIVKHPLRTSISRVLNVLCDIRDVVDSGHSTIDVFPARMTDEIFRDLVKVTVRGEIETNSRLEVYKRCCGINVIGGRFFDVIPPQKREAVYRSVNNWLDIRGASRREVSE